ncbi:MAG TPA: hypothetical protein VLZ50_05060 [Terracidiphilus sp.]|nr:hypothetical protein [Terracidiphilus sp.]
MPLAPKSAPESVPSTTAPEPAAIREQLDRLLSHALFANSKRYPALLAYTVEQTMRGNASELKERSIGIEVFGRSPSYDANADPIVRITAGEVRKKLAQYYNDPDHGDEPIIELPTGSYVPVFHAPAAAGLARGLVPVEPIAMPMPAAAAAPAPERVTAPHRPARSVFLWIPWLLLPLGIAAAGDLGIRYGKRNPDIPPPNLIDRFWAPITSGASLVTYCLGEPAKNLDLDAINSYDAPVPPSKPQPLYFRLHLSGHLALADVITLTRAVAPMEAQHKAFRVLPASEATYAQLREGPIVLIGAFDNIWTLRVTQKLRFGFDSKDGVALIVDRKSRQETTWATAWDLPYQKLSRDYAIIARIHDQTTGQPVIVAAGISEEGTEAAGESVYKPEYLEALLKNAPANWEQMNLEAVIETQVIEGHPGPPQVQAVEFW